MSININNGIPGNTSGSAIPSGYVGQNATFISGSTSAAGSTANTQVLSFTLPAGIWILSGFIRCESAAGTTPAGNWGGAINSSNNIFSLDTNGTFTQTVGATPPASQPDQRAFGLGYYISVGGTYYVNAYAQYSNTAPTFRTSVNAVRIA